MIKKWISQSNFRVGRNGQKPIIIIIHVGDGSQRDIYNTFANPRTEKSSHYSVDRNGELWQFVEEQNSAFCNGVVWNPTSEIVREFWTRGININDISVGIEHSGYGNEDITEAQYQTTARLINDIAIRWAISLDRKHILRHNEIRGNKICPGKIDVDRLLRMAIQIRDFQPAEKKTEEIQQEISKLQQIVALLNKIKFLRDLINKYKQ